MSLFGVGRRYYRAFKKNPLRSSDRLHRFLASFRPKGDSRRFKTLRRIVRRKINYGS